MRGTRIDESRARLVRAFYFALGGYTEQEAKKLDEWRDQSLGQLYDHLRHELDEIRSNLKRSELSYLVHNCVDAVGLSTILLATAMEMADLDPSEEWRGRCLALSERANEARRLIAEDTDWAEIDAVLALDPEEGREENE